MQDAAITLEKLNLFEGIEEIREANRILIEGSQQFTNKIKMLRIEIEMENILIDINAIK